MILPGNYALSLALLILSMLCWGSWANTQKEAGPKWRFELYYIDFAMGVLLAAIVAGLTLGTLGWDGFSLLDDLRLAGKRQELFGFLAGCVFNLANFLLVAAVSLTGLAIAFPVTMGLAAITGTLMGLVVRHGAGVLLGAGGCAVTAAAVALAALAWRDFATARLAAVPDPSKGKAFRKRFSFKGIVIAALGGILMGGFSPLLSMARYDEDGLGPYSLALVFALGVFLSTLIYSLFFMNLPLQGRPVELSEYFRGSIKQHVLGILGGMLSLTGTLAALVVFRADGTVHLGPSLIYGVEQASALLALVWGIFAWKELPGAGGRVKTLVAACSFLYLAGVALVSLSLDVTR